jgi:hypothetical protein
MSDDRPISVLADYVRAHTREATRGTPGAISVHFFDVEIVGDPAREELVALIEAAAGDGYYLNMGLPGAPEGDDDPPPLTKGQSYIALGAWIGDQGLAMQLLALGHAVRIWDLVTPASLRIFAEAADTVARLGYVLANGYWPEGRHERRTGER